MAQWDEWLRHRIRAYIWKQWKKTKTKRKNLMKLGMLKYFAKQQQTAEEVNGLR